MQKMGRNLWLALVFALVVVRMRGEEEEGGAATSLTRTDLPQTNDVGKNNKTYNDVVVNNKRNSNGGGGGAGGGGGVGWGWGGGGGGGNQRGGWGWGNGGGGGVFWRWGCGRQPRRSGMKRGFPKEDYKTGEFAQCMVKGRCRGMRLDCPLHCGGPCFYDCRHMCKAHCKR